jgi:hypothetical protein
MFTITTEPKRWLVRLKFSGQLTLDDVGEFYRQEEAAIKRMGCPLGFDLVIIDATECPLQLQDIVSAFQKTMSSPRRAKRVAVVTGRSLARMQARRLLQRDEVAMFDTIEEAEEWLFSASKVAA